MTTSADCKGSPKRQQFETYGLIQEYIVGLKKTV